MNSFLTLTCAAMAGTRSLVGTAIGVFYRKKFGEGTHGWLLPVGGATGILGLSLEMMPSISRVIGDLVALSGAVVLSVGTFWLWYVMMGPKK